MADNEVKMTEEQIKKANEMRSTLGQELLPIGDDKNIDPNKKPDAELTAEQIEAKKKEDELATAKLEEERLAKEKADKEKEDTSKNTPPEPTEEELEKLALKYLSKKKGSEITSLDEILNPKKDPTPEELEEAKAQRENEKIAFGLQKGKISKKELESYNIDMSDPLKVVYEDFKADIIADNPNLTEDEIEEAFDAKYNQDKEDTTIEFKRGKKEIEILATNIIRSKHSKVLSLDSEFDQFENSEKSKTEIENKIKSAIPQYQKDVEAAFAKTAKITVPISETESFEFDVDPTTITEHQATLLNPDYAISKVKQGYKAEDLAQEINLYMLIRNLGTAMTKYADKVAYDKQKGTHGIPPVDGKESTEPKVMSEKHKAVYRQVHGEDAPLPNN